MPPAPLRPCPAPGCRELVRGKGRCPTHAKAHNQQREAQRTPRLEPGFYGSQPWRRMRAIVLREEPLCSCGCGQRSDTVDHIIDRRARPDLALERSNLRAMAKACHDRRTARDHLNRKSL